MIVKRKTTAKYWGDGPRPRHLTRYGVRVKDQGAWRWVGTFDTLEEARDAEHAARKNPKLTGEATVGEIVDRYLTWYRDNRLPSSLKMARQATQGLKDEFGTVKPSKLGEEDAARWALENRWRMGPVVACLNWAVDRKLTTVHPFKGMHKRTAGRRDHDPLTVEQVDRLAELAGSVHPPLGSLVLFAAYTGLRVSECLSLEWGQVDFRTNRIDVVRAKSRKREPAYLSPQAALALSSLPQFGGRIFRARQGGPLTYRNLAASLWPKVQVLYGPAPSGENVDFHELRHFAAHHMYVTLNREARVVAAQLGHSDETLVRSLYGHFKHGALDELAEGFEQAPTVLRKIEGGAA